MPYNPDENIGQGFIIRHENINPRTRSSICDACSEDIDVTDGDKFVKMQLRTKGKVLNFHEGCYGHVITGMVKFYEAFLQNNDEHITETYLN
jgi:hypothetical protein